MEKASLQRDLFMERAPCKGEAVSFWKRALAKGFPFGAGFVIRVISIWKVLFVKGFPV